MLESLCKRLNTLTLDEVICLLIMQQRRQRLEEVFEVDRGRIKPFSEKDWGEDRNRHLYMD